ncbi:MAG: hypothetical protein RLZZ546_2737 [Bacteroidota bacterium]|jgi:hypothetical protein
MEYIKDNIQWLFSGVVIYILGVVASLITLTLGLRSIKFNITFKGDITNKK